VAVAANIAAVLASAGFTEPPGGADVWAVVVLLAVGGVGVAEELWTRGRVAVAAAIVWGLAWVAVARLTGDLQSTPAAIAALVAVVAVLIGLVVGRAGRGSRGRRSDVGSMRQGAAAEPATAEKEQG
jgi:hypothetical protein